MWPNLNGGLAEKLYRAEVVFRPPNTRPDGLACRISRSVAIPTGNDQFGSCDHSDGCCDEAPHNA